MYVFVANGTAVVCEADDCTSLEVRIGATDANAVAAVSDALTSAGLGHWDGAAELDLMVDQLRALAAEAATLPDWEQRWSSMLAYAARSGWLATDSSTVRAHIAGA